MTITISGTTGVSLVQDSTITSAKIVDGTITAADLNGAQTGSAPIYGCRAWCVFNGTTTGTNAPTAGGNVTSVTRNSTGDYTITFTTAMQDANYATVVSTKDNPAVSKGIADVQSTTTSTVSIAIGNASNSALYDSTYISVVIFR